jgi:hypothetical protein
MRFLPVFAIAAWLPHVNNGYRWLVLAAFVASLVFLLRGIKT